MAQAEMMTNGQNATAPNEDPSAHVVTETQLFLASINQAGALSVVEQTTPNGDWGQPSAPAQGQTFDPYSLRATMTVEGHAAILAQTTGDPAEIVLLIQQSGVAGTGMRTQTLDMPDGVGSMDQYVLIRGADGLLNIFALSQPNSTVWWRFQNPNKIVTKQVEVTVPGTDQKVDVTEDIIEPSGTWSDWQNLGTAGDGVMRGVNSADGLIYLFATKQDGTPLLSYQKQNDDDSVSWEPFTPLPEAEALVFGDLEARVDDAGFINLFGISGSNVYVKEQQDVTKPDFEVWEQVASAGSNDFGAVAIAPFRNGGLMFIGAQRTLQGGGSTMAGIATCQVETAPGKWKWSPSAPFLSLPSDTTLAMGANASGLLSLFYIDTGNGNVVKAYNQATQNSPTGWNGVPVTVLDSDVVTIAATQTLGSVGAAHT